MPFAFTLSGEPRDASYLSLIDAEQLFSSNDKVDIDVKRNTLASLTTNPIVVSHTWFVNERAWHTTQKVLASLQCALQYRDYVNKHTIRRRKLEMMTICKKYKEERDNALMQLKVLRQENTRCKHELETQILQNKEVQHELNRLLSQRKRKNESNRHCFTKLTCSDSSKSALTCSQCGNVYPSVNSLESHIVKRHKRSKTFAENAAKNIGALAATTFDINADTNMYSTFCSEGYSKLTSFPFMKRTNDVYNLLADNAKSDTEANNELLELLQNALRTVDEIRNENTEETNNATECDNRHNNEEQYIAQGTPESHHQQQNEESALMNTLLLPGMKTKHLSNQNLHNEEMKNETLRELLEETLVRLQDFEVRYGVHKVEQQKALEEAGKDEKLFTAKHQKSTSCIDIGVQTLAQEHVIHENADTFSSNMFDKPLHSEVLCPEWLHLPAADKINNYKSENLGNNKHVNERNEESKVALDTENILEREEAKINNSTLNDQIKVSVSNIHEVKSSALIVEEPIKVTETSPSTAMAISPLTVSPLSASNLPSPASLPPSSVHLAPLLTLKEELTTTNNVTKDKQQLMDNIASTQSHKYTEPTITSLSDLAHTLISESVSKNSAVIASIHASRHSTRSRYSDIDSAERNDNPTLDTMRSKSLSSSASTTQVEKQSEEKQEEKEEVNEKQQQQQHEEQENVENRKEKKEIDVIPLKVESLAETRSTDKLDAPAFSISPKSIEPRKHTHNQRNWLTDEYHVDEAITTSKAFTEKPVILNLPAPQEVLEEDVSHRIQIDTSSTKHEKAHERIAGGKEVKREIEEEQEAIRNQHEQLREPNKMTESSSANVELSSQRQNANTEHSKKVINTNSNVTQMEPETKVVPAQRSAPISPQTVVTKTNLLEEQQEQSAPVAPSSYTSQYPEDESTSTSSSSYSFTSTAESSKYIDNYKNIRAERDQRVNKLKENKEGNTTVEVKQEMQMLESKHERNTTQDDATAFTISYDEEVDTKGEEEEYDNDYDYVDVDNDEDGDNNYGDADEGVTRDSEHENERKTRNDNKEVQYSKAKLRAELTTNALDKKMQEVKHTEHTPTNEQHKLKYQEQEQQQEKKVFQGKSGASLQQETHRTNDTSSYMYSDDAFTETDQHSLSHPLHEVDEQLRSLSPTEENSKSKHLSLKELQKTTNTHRSTSHDRSSLPHRRRHHHHRHHNQHENAEEGILSNNRERSKESNYVPQRKREEEITRRKRENTEEQLVHNEGSNYTSLKPNTSTLSKTASIAPTSRIHTLPSTYASSEARVSTTAKAVGNAPAKSSTTTLPESSSLSMQNRWSALNNSYTSEQSDETNIKTRSSDKEEKKKKKRKTITNFFKNIFKSKDKTDTNSKKKRTN